VSKSDDIRALARDGLAVADIARRVGVRYQHAYNVLKAAGLLSEARSNVATRAGVIGGERAPRARAASPPSARPSLTAELLLRAAFEQSARWILVDGALVLDRPLPKDRGVYAFVKNGVALYVGLATPSNLEWNGLPVSGDAGLELGLIETFSLPWNIRGVRA